MTRTAGTRGVVAAAMTVFLLASCALGSRPPAPKTSAPAPSVTAESPAGRSQAALDELVGDSHWPGCTAAVGERGTVLWQGVSGQADLETGAALTPESLVNMGSVAKQFTATALLLLEHEGRLSLTDKLSTHVNDLPDWAGDVALGQLMRHTSGIPEYFVLLQEQSISMETKSTREDALKSLRKVDTLNFEPGSTWEYSNSNYLLLGLVIEAVTDAPLGDHLDQVLFRPLDLELRSTTGGGGPPSYRRSVGGDAFEQADWHWDAAGAAGLESTPSTLVRWADTYRTGAPAGPWLNTQRLADAAPGAPEDSRYGAGVIQHPDGWLGHDGNWAGFNTAFLVSGDRQRALALTCLRAELDPWPTAVQLSADWFAPAR
jgi:CubicO group peptidase (beta-lactamase class C family)